MLDWDQSDDVASDANNWMHWTQAKLMEVPYEPSLEVDEVHQYRKPIGGAFPAEDAPSKA